MARLKNHQNIYKKNITFYNPCLLLYFIHIWVVAKDHNATMESVIQGTSMSSLF